MTKAKTINQQTRGDNMKLKRGLFLTTVILAMGLLLSTSAASATQVLFEDVESPDKATRIIDLQIGDILYDVTFRPGVTAAQIYGQFPGQFPLFDTATAAEGARDAVNSALLQSGAMMVGDPTSGTMESESFNIGFMSYEYPRKRREAVIVAQGAIEGTDWISLGITPWLYYVDKKTWADFSTTTSPGTIGGTVTGLVGTGLVMQLNNPDTTEAIEDNGEFLFTDLIYTPETYYDVTVFTQPEGQTCSVENGSGVMPSDGPVTDIVVSCDEPSDELPVITDCPSGTIVGGEYSAILLSEYQDCLIMGVAVTGGVIVKNPRHFTLVNSYVKGMVKVNRDNKASDPSTAILLNNLIDGGNVVIKELSEVDVRMNSIYGGTVRIIDDSDLPDQYAEIIGNRIKGGNLKVKYNLSADVKSNSILDGNLKIKNNHFADVKLNSTQGGNIICRENRLLDARGNEAEEGYVRCGDTQ